VPAGKPPAQVTGNGQAAASQSTGSKA